MLDALFKGVSTEFGPRTIEKCFENPHVMFCSSFQNLRLGWVNLHFEHFDKSVNLDGWILVSRVKERACQPC